MCSYIVNKGKILIFHTHLLGFFHAKSLQSCLTLCEPKDCSPPGSCVHGIFQAGILEWVAISLRDSPNPGIKLGSPALASRLLTTWEDFCRVVQNRYRLLRSVQEGFVFEPLSFGTRIHIPLWGVYTTSFSSSSKLSPPCVSPRVSHC